MEKELEKKLNWKEKIIYKVFRRTIVKICNVIRMITINHMLS